MSIASSVGVGFAPCRVDGIVTVFVGDTAAWLSIPEAEVLVKQLTDMIAVQRGVRDPQPKAAPEPSTAHLPEWRFCRDLGESWEASDSRPCESCDAPHKRTGPEDRRVDHAVTHRPRRGIRQWLDHVDNLHTDHRTARYGRRSTDKAAP